MCWSWAIWFKGGTDIYWWGQRNAQELATDEPFSVCRAGGTAVGINQPALSMIGWWIVRHDNRGERLFPLALCWDYWTCPDLCDTCPSLPLRRHQVQGLQERKRKIRIHLTRPKWTDVALALIICSPNVRIKPGVSKQLSKTKYQYVEQLLLS